MLYDDTVVLLYAKAPVAGKVNTRLIPDIGESAATQLQLDLIHHRLQMLVDAELCDVILMGALDIRHDCFLDCKQRYPITLNEQFGNDIGERMVNGIKNALQTYKHVIVIGTDAPALDSAGIKQAIDKLHEQTDVVIIPAEDGGYVLLGLNKTLDYLFEDISWGTSYVMQQSRDLLVQNGDTFAELETSWDVDRIEDYQRFLELSTSCSR